MNIMYHYQNEVIELSMIFDFNLFFKYDLIFFIFLVTYFSKVQR